jgi:hypothetical protein
VTRFRKQLQQHAERLVVVLPVDQAAELRVGLVRQFRVDTAQRDVAGELLLEIERLARLDVDVASDAAFDVGCFGVLCTTTAPTSSDGSKV